MTSVVVLGYNSCCSNDTYHTGQLEYTLQLVKPSAHIKHVNPPVPQGRGNKQRSIAIMTNDNQCTSTLLQTLFQPPSLRSRKEVLDLVPNHESRVCISKQISICQLRGHLLQGHVDGSDEMLLVKVLFASDVQDQGQRVWPCHLV